MRALLSVFLGFFLAAVTPGVYAAQAVDAPADADASAADPARPGVSTYQGSALVSYEAGRSKAASDLSNVFVAWEKLPPPRPIFGPSTRLAAVAPIVPAAAPLRQYQIEETSTAPKPPASTSS